MPVRPVRVPVLKAGLQGKTGPEWLAGHAADVRASVAAHGAVFVRGLRLRTVREVRAAVGALGAEPMIETEPFALRPTYEPGVYGSAKWPSDQPMCMHHELSYALRVPALLAIACLVPPDDGGVTALADGSAVLRDLDPALVDRFEQVGWELVRTHDGLVGLPWREAFGTDDRAEVDRYCAENAITAHWRPDGTLRTGRIRNAVLAHPRSGDRVWFNQIAYLSEWTLDPTVHGYLIAEFGPDGLPFTTRFGDGKPLDREKVNHINDVYQANTMREPWQAGDLLVVDNLRMAHSREPYTGPRDIVVLMADPFVVKSSVR